MQNKLQNKNKEVYPKFDENKIDMFLKENLKELAKLILKYWKED